MPSTEPAGSRDSCLLVPSEDVGVVMLMSYHPEMMGPSSFALVSACLAMGAPHPEMVGLMSQPPLGAGCFAALRPDT